MYSTDYIYIATYLPPNFISQIKEGNNYHRDYDHFVQLLGKPIPSEKGYICN